MGKAKEEVRFTCCHCVFVDKITRAVGLFVVFNNHLVNLLVIFGLKPPR